MSRKIKINPNPNVRHCPKCGNNTEFEVFSQQVAEDYCNIWAQCICGYDPTDGDSGNRIEDVWGGCSDENCLWAIDVTWNGIIEPLTPHS
jgi:hypothetical protein